MTVTRASVLKGLSALAVGGVGTLVAHPAWASMAGSSSLGSSLKVLTPQESEFVRKAFAENPREFHKIVSVLSKSTGLREYFASYSDYSREEQVKVLAASLDLKSAEALVEVVDTKQLIIRPRRDLEGNPAPEVAVEGPAKSSQEVSAMAWTGPQCPAAWAALYARFATETAMCGALGFFGPGAALGCALAMTVLGSIPDFNAGC